MIDHRRLAPATQRNRDAILAVLREHLPQTGTILEIASGSGEHIVYFAQAFPRLTFQPSDVDAEARDSIAAWIAETGVTNALPPIAVNAVDEIWPLTSADAILCINMIHIAPWAATLGLFERASALLAPGAPLYLYGPYRRGGLHTAPSNAAFDADLQRRNPQWGVRDLDAITSLAAASGFGEPVIVEMPANNLSVVFRRR